MSGHAGKQRWHTSKLDRAAEPGSMPLAVQTSALAEVCFLLTSTCHGCHRILSFAPPLIGA